MKKKYRDSILSKLDGKAFIKGICPDAKPSGDGWYTMKSPLRKDENASFSYNTKTNGYYDHTTKEKGTAIDLVMKLYNLDYGAALDYLAKEAGVEKPAKEKRARRVCEYVYLDKDGKPTYRKVRLEPKSFYIEMLCSDGKWQIGLKDVLTVPYELPSVLKAEIIYIVEGEKDVETLKLLGFVATTSYGGAKQWDSRWNEYFVGKTIICLPDNDEAGRGFSQLLLRNLSSKAKSFKIVSLPNLPEKGDISDWVELRRREGKDNETIRRELLTLVDAAPIYVLSENLETHQADSQYFVDDKGYLCRWKKINDVVIPQRLANFNALIVEEITEDDGNSKLYKYVIEGKTKDRQLPKIEVLTNQFPTLGWSCTWGNQAVLEPGQSIKDYVRHAIQINSHNVQKTDYYTHAGWRDIDGKHAYLSGGGAIGCEDVRVKLPDKLQRYSLPVTVNPETEIEAIKKALSFLELGKKEIMYPLFSLIYLAPLTTILEPMPNFVGYLYGESGCHKTTIAISMLAHFGNFTSQADLQNFSDTANSLEKRAFLLKDSLMVLDDYHPSTSRKGAQQMEDTAQRLIRAYANRTARNRMNSDTSDRGSYTPRGILLVTGEEIVSLQSTLARSVIIEMSKGDINTERLTELQKHAAMLPEAMTSYILWVAKQIDEIKKDFYDQFTLLRNRASINGHHSRLPEQTAFQYYALCMALNWAVDRGALSEVKAAEISDEGWNVFCRLSEKQSRRLQSEDPVQRFIDIVETLTLQGRICLENKSSDDNRLIGGQNGELVGYYDEQFYYFLPTAIWNTVIRFCEAERKGFPISKETFYRMLKNKGMIEAENNTSTKTERLKGKIQRVLKLCRGGICVLPVTSVTEAVDA